MLLLLYAAAQRVNEVVATDGHGVTVAGDDPNFEVWVGKRS